MNDVIYRNITGKTLQHPLRLSEQFSWSACERVRIVSRAANGGYILESLAYDHEVPEMRGWISESEFNNCFASEEEIASVPLYKALLEGILEDDGLSTDLGEYWREKIMDLLQEQGVEM
jgi:hypothetical protein